MRVNVYAEEMTDRIEVISKTIDGRRFTGLRLYLELPVSVFQQEVAIGKPTSVPNVDTDAHLHSTQVVQVSGPFIHRPHDDDSAAVTFWGKKDLRAVLRKMLAKLDEHYATKES